ncbi:hypothetical protein CAOG_08725 [Capsaspora owczarzaki ATCC 30864]|uniref:hypothetical protein n=1 Tax=Capsaspora owczarzaki (strain ATCC 30864) TaxID=595528 RepID=UPI0003525F4D|nr:hypothetical protein CAOG_08725 [Capsaspora owczarzaki ATCC 30864]|eukprot:XP_011270345.1 hypothetical protein CAOG_08725 [Capsaspora owczarzaki ATCC 30864]
MFATLHPRRVSGSRRRSSGGSSHTLDILAGLSSGSSATSLPSPPASPRHMPQPGVISEEGADLAAKTSPTTSPKTTRASLRKLSRSSATSVGSVGSVPHSTAPLTTSPLSPRKAASSTSKLASLQRDEAASHSDSDVAAANKQALLNGESSDKFLDDVASPLPTFTTNERGQLVAQVPAGGAAPNLQRRKSSGDTSLSGSRLLVSDKPGTTTTAAAAAAAAAAADPASPVKRAGRLSNSGPGVSLSSVTPFVPTCAPLLTLPK